MDIYTIIFLALAVFIFLKLRSVLGQRTGSERPPYDPYAPRDARGAAAPESNVVALPNRQPDAVARPSETEEEPATDRWKGVAEPGSKVAAGLDAIASDDPRFDAKHFVAGARSAYEMVVTAFADGDRRTLQNLLSKEVYEGFEPTIAEREQRGEKAETRFVSLDKADVMAAELRGHVAQLTLRFVSSLINTVRDREGNVIDGTADAVTEVTDVWTFARDTTSRDPNWKLVATGGH